MKSPLFILVFCVCMFSCKSKKTVPDVSKISVDLKLERFDRDFFAIDTNNVPAEISRLSEKYPVLTYIFLQNVLGLDSSSIITGVRQFLGMSHNLFDTVNTVFKNTDALQKEFKKAFQYVKYYFPNYVVPVVTTIIGPVDALAQSDTGPTPDFLAPGMLGISLQFYLGKDFSVYNDPLFVQNVVPAFRSRRFSKEYITSDAMDLVVSDLFPYKGNSLPLVEQMVEKGKRWWLLEKFLPHEPDSIRTGYTAQQLKWCDENEGLIWGYIVKNEDLYSLNPTTIQTYLGEAPFTQGFSQEYSPGNLGQWIGWQIVKKYADKNQKMKPEELMKMDPKKILEEAKYKPK